MSKKGGLGRGLDALFYENADSAQPAAELRISEIEPNKLQPRKDFDEESLAELSESISQHGVLQPLLVRPMPNGRYQIVAGERRWRASRMAGIETVPVVIKELNDTETMELALIENLQREDLNPVEEAEGYKQLLDTYGMKQDEISSRVGKSRPAVTNAMRLLSLPREYLELIRNGEISAGHGRALLAFENKERQKEAAEKALQGASVREIEKMTQLGKVKVKAKEKKDSYYSEVEIALTNALGRKVKIISGRGKGTIEIEFYGKDDLTQIANILGKEVL